MTDSLNPSNAEENLDNGAGEAGHHVVDSLEAHRKHGRKQGNLLAITLALMAVLMTIVIAMHTTQVQANRSVSQAEAELHFRQSAEFQTVELLFGDAEPPEALRVRAKSELMADNQMSDQYASKLWEALPDWRVTDDLEAAPGHRTVKLFPSTTDQALNVFAGKFLWMVSHNDGGYAVYAPNGALTLEQGRGWANPAFADDLGVVPGLYHHQSSMPSRDGRAHTVSRPGRPATKLSADMFSGVPFLMAGKGPIEVARLPYGYAYSQQGPIDLGENSQDLSIAYIGPLPLRRYEKQLKRGLDEARSQLIAVANSGDKTGEIGGQGGARVSEVLDMMLSGNPGALKLNLEQALKFPFPTLPGSATLVPETLFDVWLHMPFTPDFFDAGTVAEADLAEATESEAQEASERAAETVLSISLPEDVPRTRAEDGSIPDTGIKGWPYGQFFPHLPEILVFLSGEDMASLAASISADVRLVHFGGKENDLRPGFGFGDGFFCEATFTVPRGRPFMYRGKMEIAGDLWLQKGSVMHVTGDLILRNPGEGSGPMSPSGKLILEQGATLIVDGDFRCEGTPSYGSLWVCAPPNRVSPVTSAILVQGSARFPNGSFSASSLDDMAGAIDGLAAVSGTLGTVLTETAPNLGKVAGPFYQRQPYFASFAATFQLKMQKTLEPGRRFRGTVGTIPIPMIVPRPLENALVPFFRALTATYSEILNASLGENLYTHADWWAFGEGVAAATIKLNPAGPVKTAMNVNLSGVRSYERWEQALSKWTSIVYQEAGEFVMEQVGQKLATAVMVTAVAPGPAAGQAPDSVKESVNQRLLDLKSFKDDVFDDAWGPNNNDLKRLTTAVDREIRNGLKDSYLREVTGALIHADTISVGEAGSSPLLMAGMLVANNDIDIEAESFVGSLTSFQGSITARKVYFTPLFTRASLYKPRASETDVLARTPQYQYGQDFDSGKAVDIRTGVFQITTEAWNR